MAAFCEAAGFGVADDVFVLIKLTDGADPCRRSLAGMEWLLLSIRSLQLEDTE
jgi:hypothetical protein